MVLYNHVILVCFLIERCITKIFESPVTNKALTNHVISTPTVTSAQVCEIECFLEIKCESYNFGAKEGGGHVCELSDSDAVRDPLEWTTKEGFVYRGTKVLITLHNVYTKSLAIHFLVASTQLVISLVLQPPLKLIGPVLPIRM